MLAMSISRAKRHRHQIECAFSIALAGVILGDKESVPFRRHTDVDVRGPAAVAWREVALKRVSALRSREKGGTMGIVILSIGTDLPELQSSSCYGRTISA